MKSDASIRVFVLHDNPKIMENIRNKMSSYPEIKEAARYDGEIKAHQHHLTCDGLYLTIFNEILFMKSYWLLFVQPGAQLFISSKCVAVIIVNLTNGGGYIHTQR